MGDYTIHVTVSGLTGSGKSAIYAEIVAAMTAIGLTIEHADPKAWKAELNLQPDIGGEIDVFRPTIVMA